MFWFYVGQLRWRAYLRQTPNLNEQQRFSRLFDAIGPDINQYAFCDLMAYYAMVEAVLAWDAAHPDDFTSNRAAKENVRQGLRELIAQTRSRAEEVRARQAEICLPSGADPYARSGGAIFGTPQEMLTNYDAARFAAFRAGVTTRAEVLQALGRPEYWSYQ